MKYENANDVFPADLVAQLQKYAAGKLVYFPIKNEAKSWGENSGYRKKLLKRNLEICNKYISGATISELADDYFLSIDSIKKIIYGKRVKELAFSPSLESAYKYNESGLQEEWVQSLCSLAEIDFKLSDVQMVTGMVKLPLRLLQAGCLYQQDMTKCAMTVQRPLVVYYKKMFHCLMQSDFMLVEQIKEKRINTYEAFLIVDKNDINEYELKYGRHFITVH